ncbi:hypothetical protein Enr13x_37750 [Stieleria neptunia]|uniref:Uncharacterized protein n=1 Tax=Stieleria neptunia TaxID=2527979 RepID=A0A518HSU3_9BACT|nr:hypothetical protein [Stieleria neptunia]QDV43915.1 hypothetical protein Enr13x_37750 [Stieleria neptunia]
MFGIRFAYLYALLAVTVTLAINILWRTDVNQDEKAQALLSTILGEVLALQKWAGRFDLDENKVLGVCKGIEADVNEFLSEQISEADRETIDDILNDIEHERLSPSKDDVRQRLRQAELSESKFLRYIDVCKHSGNFSDAIQAMADEDYSYVRTANPSLDMKPNFLGSSTYVELVDTTENAKNIACRLPVVPRIGETIEAFKGDVQEVVDVRHLVHNDDDKRYATAAVYVYYAPIGDGNET